ncbi:MAG: amidohydrolase [Candidatus Phytoplasma sp.]|nr:amidohydrolase [Phytoplasma sp.]
MIKMKKLLTKFRRDLHQIPELNFDLPETNKYLINVLEKLNFELYKTAKTGIIAYKKGKLDSSIAFRADMDALPIEENNDVDYKSLNEGLMHACGHDAHMSILLGFAHLISSKELLNESIVLIFQPAEETMGGAKVIIDEGVFKQFNIKKIFGIHVYPNLDEGKIGITKGITMARSGSFEITFNGSSAHGAMPNEGIDTIVAASNFINSMQTIVARKIDPTESAVISVGTINGGTLANVIADQTVITGTIRTFNDDVFKQIEKELNNLKIGIEASFNVLIDLNVKALYPVLNNDVEIFNDVLEILKHNFECEILKPMMTSEDFSFYLEEVPGLFMMLGTRNEKKGFTYPLHHSKFNLDEQVLLKGVELYNLIAITYKLY